jgi:hypothetical protein
LFENEIFEIKLLYIIKNAFIVNSCTLRSGISNF